MDPVCPPGNRCVDYEGTFHQFPEEFTDEDVARALKGASAPETPKSNGVETMGNVGLGFMKGLGAVGRSMDPVSRVAPGLLRMLQEQFPDSPNLKKLSSASEGLEEQADTLIKPEGAAQEVGSFAAKAVPSVALGMATGGASLSAQAGLQGLLAAAQSEKKTPGGVATDAAFGAASPYGGALLQKVMKGMGGLAVRAYQAALAPGTIPLKETAKEIVPDLLDRGIVGGLDSLAKRGAAKSTTVGKKIAETYAGAAAAGHTVNADQIAMALDAVKKPFMGTISGTNQAFPFAEGTVDAIQNVQKKLLLLGPNASPEELWKFRKVLDDIVSDSNGFTKPVSPESMAMIAKKTRELIRPSLTASALNPKALEKLNAEYELWESLQKITENTIQRRVGQAPVVTEATKAALGMTAGAILNPENRTRGAMVGAAVPHVLSSPAVLTRLAALAHKASGPGPQGLARLLALLGVSQGGPAMVSEDQAPVESDALLPPSEEDFIRRYQAGAQ